MYIYIYIYIYIHTCNQHPDGIIHYTLYIHQDLASQHQLSLRFLWAIRDNICELSCKCSWIDRGATKFFFFLTHTHLLFRFYFFFFIWFSFSFCPFSFIFILFFGFIRFQLLFLHEHIIIHVYQHSIKHKQHYDVVFILLQSISVFFTFLHLFLNANYFIKPFRGVIEIPFLFNFWNMWISVFSPFLLFNEQTTVSLSLSVE